jgi:uncharacterized protein
MTPPVNAPVPLSHLQARRLAVVKQGLAGALPASVSKKRVVDTVRDLTYLQIDPVNIVSPAVEMQLWSRLGPVRPRLLEELLWTDKKLFEYWSHVASLVLTEDFPLHSSLMRRYPESLSSSWGSWRAQARRWLPANRELRAKVLAELRKGPRRIGEFEDHARTRRSNGGWGSGSQVSEMLFHLHVAGEVMVVGHAGREKIWGLAEEFLPDWVDRTELTVEEVEDRCAERALLAMGIAGRQEINFYFPRGFYQDLPAALRRLEAKGRIHRTKIEGIPGKTVRYVHDDDVASLSDLEAGDWEPRLSILSPFDSLICTRGRVAELFGFDYIHENYVPKEKRKYGVYVLPILDGDRFLGRIDPKLDRERHCLVVNAVHAEPDAPQDRATARRISGAIDRLAAFVGAESVQYTERVPRGWKGSLH